MLCKRILLPAVSLFLLLFTLNSCGQGGQKSATADSTLVAADSSDFDFAVSFKYAKGIEVQNEVGRKTVYVFSPDTPDTMAIYVLYQREKEVPKNIPKDAVAIPVPNANLACLSTTQIGALPLLNLDEILIGASSPQRINSPKIAERVERGEVHEIGMGMAKNVEQILALRPEILLTDISRISQKDQELVRSGIHVVLFNEWKERNLLGRAEWMKLIGMLFGRNQMADKVFEGIEAKYQEAKKTLDDVTDVIPIMYGQDYKGTWYIPGEYSYPTAMFADARVTFDYAPGKVSSQPYSFEYIFSRHRKAKIWICMMSGKVDTREAFLAQNERYHHFDAAKEGKIFIDRKRVNKFGGNDFWESGLYRPDLLLKDIIKITRPDALPEYETTYWKELK